MRAYSGWAGSTSRISFSFTDCSPELAQASWHVRPARRTGGQMVRAPLHDVTNRSNGACSMHGSTQQSGPGCGQ